jgi:hypothetical protein
MQDQYRDTFTIIKKKLYLVLVFRQFSPILILLFKHSEKFEGVRKFVLEKLSYLLICGKSEAITQSPLALYGAPLLRQQMILHSFQQQLLTKRIFPNQRFSFHRTHQKFPIQQWQSNVRH